MTTNSFNLIPKLDLSVVNQQSSSQEQSTPKQQRLFTNNLQLFIGEVVSSEEAKTYIEEQYCYKAQALNEEEEKNLDDITHFVVKQLFDEQLISPSNTSTSPPKSNSFLLSPRALLSPRRQPTNGSETPRKSSFLFSPRTRSDSLSEKIKKVLSTCWEKFDSKFPYAFPKCYNKPGLTIKVFSNALKEAMNKEIKKHTLIKIRCLFEEIQKIKVQSKNSPHTVIISEDQMTLAIADALSETLSFREKERLIQRTAILDIDYLIGNSSFEQDPLSISQREELMKGFKDFTIQKFDFSVEFLQEVKKLESTENPDKALELLEKIYLTYLPTNNTSSFVQEEANKEINVDTQLVSTIKKTLDSLKEAQKRGDKFVIPNNLFQVIKADVKINIQTNFLKTSQTNRLFEKSSQWTSFEQKYLA